MYEDRYKSGICVGRSVIIMLLSAVLVFGMVSLDGSFAYAESENLDMAVELYGIAPNDVITVADTEELQTALSRTGSMATAAEKFIVYLMPGEYLLDDDITVEENTILVAEDDCRVMASGDMTYLVRLSGSMYGGIYDSNYKTSTTIKLQSYGEFTDGNGRIENLTVCKSKRYGIVAQGSKGSVINGCSVNGCKASGIAALKPSGASAAGDTNIKSITNCNVSNNGEKGEGAGINLSFADVGTIDKCVINSNSDKAVSTNSDNNSGCHIGTISNCTMKKNGNNGVHIKPNCRLDHFVNNILISNDDGLVAAAITKEGTKGKSIVKDVRGNTFKSSVTQQIEAQGSGASITIGNGNTIVSGKAYGILVMKYGKVTVSGSKNIIKGNFKGIGAQSHGIIKITGNKNQIIYNKDRGVHAAKKGIISIAGSGNKISGNKRGAVYCANSSRVTLKKVKISGKIYKTSGGKVIRK